MAPGPPRAYFLIVRGPLGAGKTTVARAVAARLGGEVVSIDALLERFEWDGGSETLFLRTNELAADAVRAVTGEGHPAVVDGNFYWGSAILDLERRLALPHETFSLRVPLAVCIARDRDRPGPYGEEATREVFAKVERVTAGIPIDGDRPLAAVVDEIGRRVDRGPLQPPEGRTAITYYEP